MQEWAYAHGRFSLQDVREHSRFVRAIIELNDRWSSPWASIMELDVAYRLAVFTGDIQSFDDKIQLATLATLRLGSMHSITKTSARSQSKKKKRTQKSSQSTRAKSTPSNHNKTKSSGHSKPKSSTKKPFKFLEVGGKALCKNFQWGNCSKGKDCSYSHAHCAMCSKAGHAARACPNK